jgi:hypothetical protein
VTRTQSRILESGLWGNQQLLYNIAPRHAPGMIYVSDRSADSICDTALLFLAMKSEYMPSHRGGSESTSPVFCVACLYIELARQSAQTVVG